MDMFYEDINDTTKDGEIPAAYSQDDEFDGNNWNLCLYFFFIKNFFFLINKNIYIHYK